MDANKIFPSTWLKSADVQGRELNVTIAGLKFEEIENEQKPVLAFNGTDKTLVLNKTNVNKIAELHGGETDAWPGKMICMYVCDVQYRDNMVPAIRIKAPVDNQTAPVQPPPPPPSADADDPFSEAPHPDSTGADSLPF